MSRLFSRLKKHVVEVYKWGDAPVLAVLFVVVWFLLNSFVTVNQHEKAQASMKMYVDSVATSQKDSIEYIRQKIDVIDQRIFELHKGRVK